MIYVIVLKMELFGLTEQLFVQITEMGWQIV